jgi:cysteinyl-tRNA synthetase
MKTNCPPHFRFLRTQYCKIMVLIPLFFILTCANKESNPLATKNPSDSNWVYQLQNPKIQNLASSGFPLAVIDYSSDGSDKKRFLKYQLQLLIKNNLIPISYISIGEAESYRFYWENSWVDKTDDNQLTSKAPKWLGHTNPDWQENYKVRYWDPDWRNKIIKPYLDKIIEQGFNGVYLDIIDGFEYWSNPEIYDSKKELKMEDDPINDEEDAAKRMIELVLWIAEYGREHSPLGQDFLIFPQNGERILLYDEDGSYLESVSGIGVEDTWYYNKDKQSRPTVKERLRLLKKFREKGKQVLSVDYVDTGDRKSQSNSKRIKDYFSQCRTQGFSCYAGRTDTELNIINRIPGIQP